MEKVEEKKTFEPLWVWVLRKNAKSVYAAQVFNSECTECGKQTRLILPYVDDMTISDVPLYLVNDNALIYVPPSDYESRSGLSWDKGQGFFVLKRHLKIAVMPKHMGTQVLSPSPCREIHLAEHIMIWPELTENVLVPTKKTICFECLLKKMPEPDIKQGNLRIWKVNDPYDKSPVTVFFRKARVGKESDRIFNHIVVGSYVLNVRENEKGALMTCGDKVTIISTDHKPVELESGYYALYHPKPTSRGD